MTKIILADCIYESISSGHLPMPRARRLIYIYTGLFAELDIMRARLDVNPYFFPSRHVCMCDDLPIALVYNDACRRLLVGGLFF